MKIIIIGATIVGTELAEYLVQAGHAVTIIDKPSEELTQIGNRLDLRVVQGEPTWPSVLKEAGASNTELLVATSPYDEVNIAACSIAHALFNIPRKIARMRSPDFLSEADTLFGEDAIPIDYLISPEHLVADAVLDLMSLPGVNAFHTFSNDRLIIASAIASQGGKLLGQEIKALENYDSKCQVLAVYRDGKLMQHLDGQLIQEGDEIFFCAERSRALNLIGALVPLRPSGKNVVIEGGSHIADTIALRLSNRYHVKLIEPDQKRAQRIAERFNTSNIELYCADASDLEFVMTEKLYHSDIFIAASPNEETNIMSSLMMQRTNKVRTLAIIRQQSFQEIALNGNEIDAIISPREVIISALLSNILQEGVEKIRIFKQGQAEAIEILVRGTKRSSSVVGRKIQDVNLPNGVTLGLILRNKVILKPDENYIFEDGDKVIAYLSDRACMRPLVKLFKPRSFWLPKW